MITMAPLEAKLESIESVALERILGGATASRASSSSRTNPQLKALMMKVTSAVDDLVRTAKRGPSSTQMLPMMMAMMRRR